MMKIEAECLLGREMDDEEFDLLNDVYMETRYDKETVCKTWGNLEDTRVLVDLAVRAKHLREQYTSLAASHRDLFAVVKRKQAFVDRIQWMNVKIHGYYIVFERERMKCVAFARSSRKFFVGNLFHVPEHERRFKYESKEPMPKEAMDVLALMGYEVEGPL